MLAETNSPNWPWLHLCTVRVNHCNSLRHLNKGCFCPSVTDLIMYNTLCNMGLHRPVSQPMLASNLQLFHIQEALCVALLLSWN